MFGKGPVERRGGGGQGVKAYLEFPEALILDKLRMIKATIPRERSQKDRDDITAILENTRVSKRKIIDQARKQSTIEILRGILPVKQARKRSFFGTDRGIAPFTGEDEMTDHD